MRIVVVEDEMCIREGLVKLLERIDRAYLVVGQADNGKSGLELIKESKPDLVITDVQMPIMDGLEMLRCLQEKQPLPKVIILSAYSEFSYAQQAIKLGVSEYLIKPIMVNELTQALRMVEQQLKTKAKKKEELPELDTLGELLTGFQVGRLKYSEALESYVRSKFSVEIQGNYIMILAYLGDHYEEERKRTIPALTALLKDTISKKCQILDFLVFKSCLFIFPCEGEEAVLVKRFQKTILTRICNDSMASFGWIRFTGLSQLAESAATLQGCMDWCIPLGNGVIIHYPRIKQLQTSPLSYPVDIENQMKTAICMANPTKLQETFRDFQSYFRKGALYDPKKIKESYLRFIWSVINVAKELDLSRYFAIDQQALLESVMEAVTNEELEKNIYEQAGKTFNINSPKQLGVILFEKLGMPNGKKTKSGYSTAADVLEKLAPDYPVVSKILEYRQLAKLKSTYADGLTQYIAEDGRIHGTFNQTITATGRISSTEPNLQNIPIRMEMGKAIRKVFVPKDGFVFLDADYSQIELRILAHMSGDEKLIQAYKEAQDIHRHTASEVFHVPFNEVTDLQRRNAKAVNFGIVYGISSFGLSQDLSITRKEAAAYIEKYFETYPKIKGFLDGLVKDGKEHGYVTTMFGRRRPVPELRSSNFMQRSFGERVAMNSPIQGTAADIIKIAMNHVYERMKKEGLRSRLVLQVHDELLIETKKEEIEEVSRILEEEMKGAADLAVELDVDMHQGDSWYEAK